MTTMITPSGGTGLTSELSVRLHHVAAYHREHGVLPEKIDGSKQFLLYQDAPQQCVTGHILQTRVDPVEVARTDYEHGWQYGWYDEIAVENLHKMVLAACAPTAEVTRVANEMIAARGQKRCALIYRGNDKAREIPPISYETMFAIAEDTGATSFIVQTDELDFYEQFSRRFDSVRYQNFPMIRRDAQSYVIAPKGKRVRFAIEFLAAVIALASAKQLVVTTGNVGIWCVLYRGHTKDVWQAHGREQTWRRLKESK